MSKSWREVKCELHPDKGGIFWDLVLYVPTVLFLVLWGLKVWYGSDQQWMGQGLMFLGFFFLLVGGGRIFRRLLLLPSSPVVLDVSRAHIAMQLKNGERRLLMRDIRFFSDKAGKSFGLTGVDGQGAKQQYVFHRGQFSDDDFAAVIKALDFYK